LAFFDKTRFGKFSTKIILRAKWREPNHFGYFGAIYQRYGSQRFARAGTHKQRPDFQTIQLINRKFLVRQ
jgi:hypothetical protein